MYLGILFPLLVHFYQQEKQGLGGAARTLRILINQYKCAIGDAISDAKRKPHEDLMWREALGAYSYLERQLISRLANLEYGAELPAKRGLEWIADKNTVRGYSSATGYQERDDFKDKQKFQECARKLWKAKPDLEIKQLKNSPELAKWVEDYPGRDTLQQWLSEIDTRQPERRRGPKRAK